MEEANVERSVAMAISGHRTESAYKRYLIGSERRVMAAGAKMESSTRRKRKRAKTGKATAPARRVQYVTWYITEARIRNEKS